MEPSLRATEPMQQERMPGTAADTRTQTDRRWTDDELWRRYAAEEWVRDEVRELLEEFPRLSKLDAVTAVLSAAGPRRVRG